LGVPRGDEVSNLYVDETGKFSGLSIHAVGAADLLLSDLNLVESPSGGIHLHNVNHVNIERVRVYRPKGTDAFGIYLSGGGVLGDGRTDAVHLKDVVIEGWGFPTGQPPFIVQGGRHGLIIDGAVNTVSVTKLYILAMQGAGVWIRNAISASTNPEFASFYGLEIDFPQFEGLRIEVGQRFYFTDMMIHQSHQRTNITVGLSNLPGAVKTVSFKGGFSTSANYSGMEIYGESVCVHGMNILANNRGNVDAPGIEVLSAARNTTITGNAIGDSAAITQSYGVRVWAGSNHYSIVGNTAYFNLFAGIRNIPGPAAGLREVVGNTGAVVL
jgi:hypothetical protein